MISKFCNCEIYENISYHNIWSKSFPPKLTFEIRHETIQHEKKMKKLHEACWLKNICLILVAVILPRMVLKTIGRLQSKTKILRNLPLLLINFSLREAKQILWKRIYKIRFFNFIQPRFHIVYSAYIYASKLIFITVDTLHKVSGLKCYKFWKILVWVSIFMKIFRYVSNACLAVAKWL